MADAETRRLLLGGGVYDCRPEETVLDALLRQGLAVPNSCRRQILYDLHDARSQRLAPSGVADKSSRQP